MHTCVTCRVVFRDSEIQREHYKSDWHRYNLKRKVAQLPSVTAEEFNNRVLQQKNLLEENNQNTSRYCEPCRKNFVNENSYLNHLNSRRHKDNVSLRQNLDESSKTESQTHEECFKTESDDDVEEVDSDEWNEDAFTDNQCLFCVHHSRSVVRNLRHMSQAHSFFIPDVEYCVDLPGLITYLSEKVYEGFMCLWCNDRGKTFFSAEAAQHHMFDKGHCKMLHEGLALAEYSDFYDYSSSYPQDDASKDPNEEINVEEIDGTDYQLVLPSGTVIGHRSLMRYYRQKFGALKTVPVVKEVDKRLHKVLAHYRATGWTTAQREQVVKKARDLHFMKRTQAKFNMQLGVKHNKLQRHFRPQFNY